MSAGQVLFGPRGLRLDARSRAAIVGDQRVELTARGFDLLQLLLERRGEVVEFDELAREVWGFHECTSDRRFLQTGMWRLRRALEEAGASDVIENVHGVGYVVRAGDAGVEALHRWQSPDHPVVIVNKNGQVRFANEAAAELARVPLHELRQMAATDIWEPGDVEAHLALRTSAWDNRSAVATGLAHHPDGSTSSVDVSMMSLDLGTDEPLFLITCEPAAGSDRTAPAAAATAS